MGSMFSGTGSGTSLVNSTILVGTGQSNPNLAHCVQPGTASVQKTTNHLRLVPLVERSSDDGSSNFCLSRFIESLILALCVEASIFFNLLAISSYHVSNHVTSATYLQAGLVNGVLEFDFFIVLDGLGGHDASRRSWHDGRGAENNKNKGYEGKKRMMKEGETLKGEKDEVMEKSRTGYQDTT